jgi:hypothetical protein
MRNRSSKPKSNDVNQIASFVLEKATGKYIDSPKPNKNPAAVALGRLGGLKGGISRAKRLSKKRRSEIAQQAAMARWSK